MELLSQRSADHPEMPAHHVPLAHKTHAAWGPPLSPDQYVAREWQLWRHPFSRAGLLVFFAIVALAGTWAAQQAERILGRKDPAAIVIDEVAGMTLAVLLLPLTVPVAVLAFALFRLFDVIKPAPARQAQALPGGAGVMVDDLVAGLYALVIVAALRALVGWP